MAVKLSPFGPKPQFEDANGNPDSGYQLFFYAANSSTKQNTYTDSGGGTANSNPIILNSLGMPANQIWFTSGQTYKVILASPTDTDPPAAGITLGDDLSGINDTTTTLDQWVSGPAPTYVSATQFTLVGDQTTAFHAGRRLKTTNSSGTIYSVITVSAFTTLTTVTVVNDSGSLDSGLSAVSYGLLSADNTSIPGVKISGVNWTHSGDITMSASMDKWAKGADVASATALPLITDGNYFDVTGTVTVTSFNSVGVGTIIGLHFDGALILTHHATDLILPGAANITTAAGDEGIFVEYASGDYRCMAFSRASGLPIVNPIVPIVQVVNTQTGALVTGTTTMPMDDTIPQNTEGIEVMTLAITPTNANNILYFDVVVFGSHSAANGKVAAVLFQDSTAGALAAVTQHQAAATGFLTTVLRHKMTAGTTSATTFKVRSGSDTAGTLSFNGQAAARIFGGVAASSITITEITA